MGDDNFDMDEFHSELHTEVNELTEKFLAILDRFHSAGEDIKDVEQVQFLGGGVQALGDLIHERYMSEIQKLDHKFHRRYAELKDTEKKLEKFEKQVLDGLDQIPITDAFDDR